MIYDIIIVIVLAALALWGMRRGLILSLCSLVAMLVAFVGALLLANLVAPAVAGALEPRFASSIEAHLEESIKHTEYVGTDGGVAETPDEVALPGVLEALKELGVPEGILNSIREAAEQGTQTILTDAASYAAAAVAKTIAFAVVFLVGFVLILILWTILSHTLDLVAKLPGLHTLNKAGGLVIGALRGVIILFVCAWLIKRLWSGAFDPETVENTCLLRFFMTVNPLEALANL